MLEQNQYLILDVVCVVSVECYGPLIPAHLVQTAAVSLTSLRSQSSSSDLTLFTVISSWAVLLVVVMVSWQPCVSL